MVDDDTAAPAREVAARRPRGGPALRARPGRRGGAGRDRADPRARATAPTASAASTRRRDGGPARATWPSAPPVFLSRAARARPRPAGLSSRRPLKAPWRTIPSPVSSRNSISATSRGSTKRASLRRLRPPAKGLVSRSSGSRRSASSLQVALAEAGADLAGVAQRGSPSPLVVADAGARRSGRGGALRRASSRRSRTPGGRVLHLQPGAVALAGRVAAVEPLHDDPLQPLLARSPPAAPSPSPRSSRPGVCQLSPSSPSASSSSRRSLVGLADQVAAVEVEEVEDHVGDRVGLHPPPDDALRGLVDPLLEALEARPAVLVEGDQLAVEDRVAGAELRGRARRTSGYWAVTSLRLRVCSRSRPGRQ